MGCWSSEKWYLSVFVLLNSSGDAALVGYNFPLIVLDVHIDNYFRTCISPIRRRSRFDLPSCWNLGYSHGWLDSRFLSLQFVPISRFSLFTMKEWS